MKLIGGRRWMVLVGGLLVLGLVLAGCSDASQSGAAAKLELAPLSGMPAEVQQAPASVRQAYQFNVANPELMQQIPCYCGCGAMGHKSNYNCYAQGVDASGETIFDSHALGCSICVDITLDTMRLLREGKDVAEIRAFIDQTYSKYGPSTGP